MNLVTAFNEIADDSRLIQDVREIVISQALMNTADQFFTIRPGIKGGQQVVAMRDQEYVTRAAKDCDLEDADFDGFSINGIEQKWEPMKQDVRIKICHTEFEGAFTQWALANGMDRHNLDESNLLDFITSLTVNAMRKDFVRLAIFGNEDALTDAVLTDGQVAALAPYYNSVKKGLIETLKYFKTEPTLAGNFITIAENAATPLSAQFNLAADAAYTIYDDLIDGMDFEQANQLLTSHSLYRNYKKMFQAKELESGVLAILNTFSPEVDGRPLTDLHFAYDNKVKKDFVQSDGTYYLPHLAVLADKSNLVIGVDDVAALEDLRFEYVGGKDENFYIKASYLMDFKIPNPYEVRAAF